MNSDVVIDVNFVVVVSSVNFVVVTSDMNFFAAVVTANFLLWSSLRTFCCGNRCECEFYLLLSSL